MTNTFQFLFYKKFIRRLDFKCDKIAYIFLEKFIIFTNCHRHFFINILLDRCIEKLKKKLLF